MKSKTDKKHFTINNLNKENDSETLKIEEGTYEYKANKYAHFFSEEDVRKHFSTLDILEIGSTVERIIYKGNETKEYILRYIIVKKI